MVRQWLNSAKQSGGAQSWNRQSSLKGVVNYLGLQLGWLACAIGAAEGYPWVGLLAVAGHLVIHFLWADNRRREAYFILLVALLGAVVDSGKKVSGLLSYASDAPLDWLAPYWIIAMWVLFATAFSTSLRWLRGRLWLAALLGAIFGPLSYVAGEQLGGVTFNYGFWVTVVVLALIWGPVMAGLAWLAEKIDQYNNE